MEALRRIRGLVKADKVIFKDSTEITDVYLMFYDGFVSIASVLEPNSQKFDFFNNDWILKIQGAEKVQFEHS